MAFPIPQQTHTYYTIYVPLETKEGTTIDCVVGERELRRILSTSFLECRVGLRVADKGAVAEIYFGSVGTAGKQLFLDEVVHMMCEIASNLHVEQTLLMEHKTIHFRYIS